MSASLVPRPKSSCPGRDLLFAFSVGNLPEEVQDTVATHLLECTACVTILDQLEDNADPVLAELRLPYPPVLAANACGPPLAPPHTLPSVVATKMDGAPRATRKRSPRIEPRPAQEAAPAARPEGPPHARRATLPERIGRYRIERALGKGSFGLVFLAHDDQLSRPVAIKVPHSQMVAEAGDAEAYLTEARTVANLDHPNIVPVHDVGSTEQYPCFVVSKYIDGIDLATRLAKSRLSLHEGAELVATVAEALHHAHQQGLVHRDIKPGNLLLDKSGKPFIADFGLALREQDVGKGPRFAGTPAYMSPEQARGEGHRVDGRSDIFSLGVVFYEVLAGRRPFRADAREELLEQITSVEPRPLRQWDDHIPRELERICLKALSKRATERYATAKDFADDLRHYLAEASPDQRPAVMDREKHPADVAVPEFGSAPASSDMQPVKIVPKGLRAFDAEDATFFLELLPGPRDREGLPESLRFWKTRIERTDPDNTFTVGLIYGPSGCGKSSLVKAGLLPRLAKWVTVVYVEATAEQTEARLQRGLRRQVPDLPSNLGLAESLAELRRGRFLAAGQKVLLVLDQFEQWLHAQRREQNTELVQALRQCDGARVQCLVMVRDDFWMGATRFLRELEIRLLEGQNALAVDLFDADHARKVLTAFGRAFGKLPQNRRDTDKDQKQFLSVVVHGLARDGKIIPVRLALFAEMVKGKPWTPATLRDVGGTKGVGVNFLEETFTAATAPPQHRLHQKAAQAVLKALLPEAGTNIKGHMRSQKDLAEASGYAGRPEDFDDLLHLLDGELRLITPTDPEGKDEGGGMKDEKDRDSVSSLIPPPSSFESLQYYQLTHDYLVPSLRDWLTRKQKETRRGRAELLLADRAAVWNARPENRQLPSLVQWLQIRALTRKKSWTRPERQLMRKASRYHLARTVAVAMLLLAVTLTWLAVHYQNVQQDRANYAAGLVGQLLDAKIGEVPVIIQEMKDYRQWTDPLLRQAFGDAEAAQRQGGPAEKARQGARQLRASLGLVPVDAGQVAYLFGRFLDAEPEEARVILDLGIAHGGRALTVLQAEVDRKLPADAQNDAKETLAKRQANAAAALLRMNEPAKVWPLLKYRPDPRVRSYLLHRLGPLGANAGTVVQRLGEEPDLTIRRALLLSLGEFGSAAWNPEEKQSLVAKLKRMYRTEPDPGLHAAAKWLLGEWHEEAWLRETDEAWAKDREKREERLESIRRQLTKASREASAPGAPPQWYVNSQGQTMVVIPGPVEFVMGSPPTEAEREKNEQQHKRRIPRTFAIAASPVTVAEYQRSLDKKYTVEERNTPTSRYPVRMHSITWYQAAAYCNWLSEREGIPTTEWCYAQTTRGNVTQSERDYLNRTGYRLPAEAEWEFACRAGATTSFSFGESAELLGRYGWYKFNAQDHSWPVGSKMPNDFGLFDMHGNVWCACQDSGQPYPKVEDGKFFVDREDEFSINSPSTRVMRGGSYRERASNLRSASRGTFTATHHYDEVGFRLVRTIR